MAVGASDSVGVGADDPLRQAWPQVFYQTALPKRAVFINLGISGATVAEALEKEVPHALDLNPTVVTVWLSLNDLTHLVSAESYEQSLGELVHRLRRDGRTKVLVGNAPPIADLPAYTACLPNPPGGAACGLGGLIQRLLPGPDVVDGLVDAYNAAIARVAAREGAVLVDLHAVAVRAREAGTETSLFSGDGFHPSVEGHKAVAAAFAEALKASGGAS